MQADHENWNRPTIKYNSLAMQHRVLTKRNKMQTENAITAGTHKSTWNTALNKNKKHTTNMQTNRENHKQTTHTNQKHNIA